MKSKKVRKLCLLSLLLGFSIVFANLEYPLNSNNVNNPLNDKDHFSIRISEAAPIIYSGVGVHQNVTEYGEGFFQNNNLNITNLENASIIVPETWEANEIAVNITNIYEYDRLWINETFDSGYDNAYWFNSTTTENKSLVIFDWYNDTIGSNDSIYIKYLYNESNNWKSVNSYWNYTFNLDRENIPYFEWSIDFNYRFLTNNTDWFTTAPGGTKIYCSIMINGKTQQFNLGKITTIDNDTWYTANIAPFTPELYEFDPPGTFNILFGIGWGNLDFNPNGYLELFFDNITLNLQTIPKPSQINLTLTDIEHGIIKQIDDISGYGLGNTTLNDSWAGSVGGEEHRFSFASNSSGKVYIYSDFFVKADSSRFTTTELEEKGSDFIVENDTLVEWTMFFPVSIPGTYSKDYYFNVSKPTNWKVTHLIDPYGADKISQVLGTSGPGNTTLVIPNEIIVNGRWKVIAESPNYLLNANIWNKTLSTWEKSSNFEVSDVLKINATIDNYLISDIETTNASLLIYYPNGTEWTQAYQEVSLDSSGNVEFKNITLGALNASAGNYIVQIRWFNQDTSQIGFYLLNFEVIHHTILSLADDQEPLVSPIYTGDTVLIKINYTDIDIRVGIIGANVNYTIDNETVITGDLVYFGGGIYVAEIDTNNWQKGLYNVSVYAEKLYYQSQYKSKLIKLEVTERTTLTSPQVGGEIVPWGNNITISMSYNGSNNQGISGAVIDCDWDLSYYSIEDKGLGYYDLILNTTIKSFDTYSVRINASKVGYENKEIFIAINIRAIFSNLTYDQPDPVNFKSNISLQLNYGDIDNNVLISGALITISSDLGSQYWNSNDFYYYESSPGIYNVTFNSTIFGGAGTFRIYITANKTNYLNASNLVNIFVEDISTLLKLYADEIDITIDRSIIRAVNQTVNITVTYKDSSNNNHIDNALITLTGGGVSENFTENFALGHYSVIINTTHLGQGINFLTIYTQKAGHIPNSLLFTIEIKERSTGLELLLNGQNKTLDRSIEITIGFQLNITILYNDYLTGLHIDSALVKLVGEGMNETLTENILLAQYSIIINSEDLNWGVNFLTVYSQKANYEPQSILVRVEIISRETTMDIYLNQENKTLEKYIELPIQANLNITIKYFDFITGTHIPNASIQLIGEGISELLVENIALEQYSISINTNQIDLGVRFLTIFTQKANYQSNTALLRINVKRINTEIKTSSGDSIINALPGEDITLSVILNDLDFNQTILNASVTYSAIFGADSLLDLDNDGIYEVVLTNVPEGNHIITIYAFAGDDYDFQRYEITLNVIRPPEETLLFQILTIVAIAAAVGIGSYFITYQKVLKYPPLIRKIRKKRKKIRKGKEVKPITLNKREDIITNIFQNQLQILEINPEKDIKIEKIDDFSSK